MPAALWQLLLVTLLGLPLITPLLRWTAVACTHDGHLHVHRVAAMKHAWENGLLFTRWLPDLAFGYGYPFFVYREAPPLYAVLLPHLAGLPLPAASNLFYALCILAAGWFMFLWVRDVAGARAAFVAAVAYMAAPYVLLDALVRGNAPESLALPLFPLVLWLGRRWLLNGSAVSFLGGVLGLALLSLSHNISTLIFVPTLLVYLLALGWLHRLGWRPLLGRVALLLGLGLGMTVFYTGGALLEMDQVTLQQSTTTRNNDFRFNFAGAGEILAPVTAEDPALLNPPLPIRLGWVPLALALLGATSLFWRPALRRGGRRPRADDPIREQRAHIILLVVATAVYLFMALPLSRPLWEALPLIDFVQFPWRFVGRAALPVAFLAGMPWATGVAAVREQPTRQRNAHRIAQVTFLLTLALLIVEAIPNLYPRYCGETLFPTIGNVHAYEHATGLVGVDPEGSYFPRTVEQRPQGSPLEADYQAGQTPQRLDLSAAPAEATIPAVDYGRLAAAARVSSPAPFTARYLSFAFPGWVATIDGRPVPITPSDPEGLITFAVPAGDHALGVRWQSTPLRTALSLVSVAALLAAVALALFSRRIALFNEAASTPAPPAGGGRSPAVAAWPLLVLALALLGVKLLSDNVAVPLLRQSARPALAGPTLQAAELRFDGYRLSQERVAAGETFDVDLAWTAVAPPAAEYQSNVWLAGPEGLLWSDKETQRPRIYEDAPPTLEWRAGQWAWDSREVRVLPGTPPGEYDVVLTLFDLATLRPLTLLDADGAVVGPTAVLGRITVTWPDAPATFAPQYPLETAVPPGDLHLLGYNQDRATAVPGESLLLTLFWERRGERLPSTITLALHDAAGEPAASWELPTVAPDFDVAAWPVGQRLRRQIALRLPAALESGAYRFVLEDDIALGEIAVQAPERIFTPPQMETAVGATFGEEAALSGYTLERQAEQIAVTLVWQALAEMDTSYHVFVHLVDANGEIIAQSDAEPAAWQRPTTGWAPGEYVVDRHVLPLPETLPAGPLSLRVGLYDVDSGRRLSTGEAAAADFVTLPLPQR